MYFKSEKHKENFMQLQKNYNPNMDTYYTTLLYLEAGSGIPLSNKDYLPKLIFNSEVFDNYDIYSSSEQSLIRLAWDLWRNSILPPEDLNLDTEETISFMNFFSINSLFSSLDIANSNMALQAIKISTLIESYS